MEENTQNIYILVCDIGGTNLRVSLLKANTNTWEAKTIKSETHVTNEYPSFHEFYTSKFLRDIPQETHPKLVVLGIAGAVFNNKACMSHIVWKEVDGDELAKQLQSKVVLINDLEAISLGITTLEQAKVIQINDAIPSKQKPIVVICPGTGFGAGYLVPDFRGDNSYEAWASEAGHSNHGPAGALQHEYYQFLQKKYNLEWVWVEKMVCGKAILDIFEFLKKRKGIETAEVEKTVELAKNKNDALNKAIFEFAMAEKEAICQETLNLFIEILATEVSNLALRFLPHSGIYLAGGIVNSISDYIIKTKDSVFLPAFFKKEPVLLTTLKQIPIIIVKVETDDLGIRGCIKKAIKILQNSKLD